VHLGYSSEGYTRQQANRELASIVEQVPRRQWTPPVAAVAEAPREVPDFHRFAGE